MLPPSQTVRPPRCFSVPAKRLNQYGKNEFTQKKKKSFLRRFFEQFEDFMILVLIAAALISFAASVFEGNTDVPVCDNTCRVNHVRPLRKQRTLRKYLVGGFFYREGFSRQ